MSCNNYTTEEHRVVISGISGRFPNSNNVAEFQDNLLKSVDCTTTDHGRWKDFECEEFPYRLGVFNNPKKFDHIFFGVNAKLASVMDPTTRMILEHSFEAIMDAGINPRQIKGAKIAVYTATTLSEAEKSMFNKKVQLEGFGIIGYSKAMLSNRISFFFGLNGPSVNIDCGDIGTGTALEKAYLAIKNGQCDAAIVGGASQCLHPHVTHQLKTLGLLSSDGFTRCFDDNADGHTRSEAITVLYLQRAQDAKRIYLEIVNTRTTHVDSIDINSVLVPKTESQIKLMKNLLNESKLIPDDISFLEASGISIADIDAMELKAIDAVYGKRRTSLSIGSVKSNIGDTKAANTNVSIIKMIIASETGLIPPNLHYKTPNSKAPGLNEGRMKVLTELSSWSGQYSMVNSTSINATVSNTILKVPNIDKKNNGAPDDDLPRLVIASGRTEEAIETILNYVEGKPLDVEFLQLLYDIFESDTVGYLYRGYSIIPANGLTSIDSRQRDIVFNIREKKEIWWIFTGMGSQWIGMGEALLKFPVFEAAIRKCDAVLKPLGYDIYKIITEKDPEMFDHIVNSFIGIAAIQIGLVDVLRAVGLEPDYMIGHSVGELGCAYADGCFSAEQMILASLSRGLASIETKLEKGSMAAVGLGYADVKSLCPPDIDVACHNGPESSTISGPAESMKTFVANLTAKGIFAKEVPSSNIAYHSRYIAPAGAKLLERLQKVIPTPQPRSHKWLSTSIPREEWSTLKARFSSAEYHTNNLLNPVLFAETSRLIPTNAICVEIAPHGLLQAILKRSLPKSCINIALARKGHPNNAEMLLTALGKLYNEGFQLEVANLYPKVQYPVGRGTASISSLIRWDHSADWLVEFFTPMEKKQKFEKTFKIICNGEDAKYLQGYIIDGKCVIPLSLCLMKAWEILKNYKNQEVQDIVFKDIKIFEPLMEITDDIIRLHIIVSKGTKTFEVMASEVLVVRGIIETTKSPSKDRLNVFQMENYQENNLELSQEDFYKEMEIRGYQYPIEFKGILKSSVDGTRALIKWNDNWVTVIDSALQLFTFGYDFREVQMPISIQKIIVDEKLQETAITNSDSIKAVLDRKLNYFYSGGLEIQGPKFTVAPKKLKQKKISHDVPRMVPNIDESNVSFSTSLRIVLQLILENNFSNEAIKMEFIENNNLQDLQALENVMYHIPEATLFKKEIILYENVKFDKILTVITDIENYNLKEISKTLEVGNFILSIFNKEQNNSFVKSAESVGLRVVLMRQHKNKYIFLLRRKQLFTTQIINVTENIKETIDKIRYTYPLSDSDRLMVIIKSESMRYVIECIDRIQEVMNIKSIRIFNIQNSKLTDNFVIKKLCTRQLDLDLLINVFTSNNDWATLRRMQVTPTPKWTNHWIANEIRTNNPFSVTWTEGPIIEKTENLAKVQYSSFNIQDILIAKKIFYTNTSEIVGKNRLTRKGFGLEFSGIDSNNNRIMGITDGNSMSNIVCVDPDWTWQVPESWSLEDAATVPFSYILAFTTLFIKIKVQPGEAILLSNACNGLGLAILNVAIHEKFDIFAAYESEEEKKVIQSVVPNLPKGRLLKSSSNSFQDDILSETGGRGIDVFISNYCETRTIEMSYPILKWNSRVISISDLCGNQIHEKIGMGLFLKQVAFHSVVPKKILSYDLETKKALANMFGDGITNGSVKPLPRIVYARNSLDEAFSACMAQQHSEKILVKVLPDGSNKHEALTLPRFYCSKNRSYVVIEGLTQFGLELVDWLIVRGGRHLIVTSAQRSNSTYQNLRLKLWKSYGVEISVHQDFHPTNQNIKSLFEKASTFGPIDAIFDLQRLSDSLVEITSSTDTFSSATKILDEVSRSLCPDLRLFVIGSKIGNPGALTLIKKFVPFDYTNTENETIEKILEQREKDNLPGLFVKWGLEDTTQKYIQNTNAKTVLLPIKKYLQELDGILGTEENTVEVSYTVSSTSEASDDPDNIAVSSHDQKEDQLFTTHFDESFNFSYLKMKENTFK